MADLLDLSTYKAYEGIVDSNNDTKLTNIISGVSDLVKAHLDRTLIDYYSSDIVETFDISTGQSSVMLKEWPVNTITSVEERQAYNEAYVAITTAAYQYYLDSDTDSVVRTATNGVLKNFPIGPQAVKVTYSGGYNGAANIPGDLTLALVDLVTYYYKNEYKQQRSIGNATLSGAKANSVNHFVGFPDHITRVLDHYRG